MTKLNEINRDQFVPDVHFVSNIKVEDDEELYYNVLSMSQTFDSAIRYNPGLKMPSISSFCSPPVISNPYGIVSNYPQVTYQQSSDGECSPQSIEDNDINQTLQRNSSSIHGIRTNTKKPNKITKTYTKGVTKPKGGRARKTDIQIPKEKDRARLFNEAFDGLRKQIPSIPASKKLSKIEILRLGICYMSYLKFLLEFDFPTKEPSAIVEETKNNQIVDTK